MGIGVRLPGGVVTIGIGNTHAITNNIYISLISLSLYMYTYI